LDVGLPGIGGIEACRQIKQRHPQLPVLVLTSHSQPGLIVRLVAAGAQGYCLKGIAAETLILALRSVAAGASWWDATATQTIRTAFNPVADPERAPASPKAGNALTQREQEILELIAAGKNNPEIAQTLYITPGTVRVHVHSILHKLGVRDRTQAMMVAMQNQLLSHHPPH
jgi:two-component system NarL family response regulator